MRFVGLILVLLGGLALGYQGFTHVNGERQAGVADNASRDRDVLYVPPVASGIAVVSGLLLLASGARCGEDSDTSGSELT